MWIVIKKNGYQVKKKKRLNHKGVQCYIYIYINHQPGQCGQKSMWSKRGWFFNFFFKTKLFSHLKEKIINLN